MTAGSTGLIRSIWGGSTLDPDLSFAENVWQVVLDFGSQFSAEPTLLI
jgi:hypothetical protein